MSNRYDAIPEGNRLNSIKGTASRLGVHWQTVRNLIERGEIRPTLIGRRKLISETEIDRFIERHTIRG